MGVGVVFFYLLMALLGLITPVIAVSAVWAIWRMTRAHERIEKHVAGIEQLLASRTTGANS